VWASQGVFLVELVRPSGATTLQELFQALLELLERCEFHVELEARSGCQGENHLVHLGEVELLVEVDLYKDTFLSVEGESLSWIGRPLLYQLFGEGFDLQRVTDFYHNSVPSRYDRDSKVTAGSGPDVVSDADDPEFVIFLVPCVIFAGPLHCSLKYQTQRDLDTRGIVREALWKTLPKSFQGFRVVALCERDLRVAAIDCLDFWPHTVRPTLHSYPVLSVRDRAPPVYG